MLGKVVVKVDKMKNLRRLEFSTSSSVSSLATHISNLAEVLFGFIAHAVRRYGVGIKMSSGAGAIAILNNLRINIIDARTGKAPW